MGLVSLKFGPILISNNDLEYLREDMANIFFGKLESKKMGNYLFLMFTAIYCLNFKSKC